MPKHANQFWKQFNSLEESSYVCQYDGTTNNHHKHKDKFLYSKTALQLPLTSSRSEEYYCRQK